MDSKVISIFHFNVGLWRVKKFCSRSFKGTKIGHTKSSCTSHTNFRFNVQLTVHWAHSLTIHEKENLIFERPKMESQPQIDIEQAQEVDEGKPQKIGCVGYCCGCCLVVFVTFFFLVGLLLLIAQTIKIVETSNTLEDSVSDPTFSVPKLTTHDVEDFQRLCAYASQQFAKCAEELWCKKCLALIEN